MTTLGLSSTLKMEKCFMYEIYLRFFANSLYLSFKDNVNNEAIWAEISSQEQNNRAFDELCGEDYFEDVEAGPSYINASQLSARELSESVDDPKFVYSKVFQCLFFFNFLLNLITVYEIYETGG